MTGQEEKERKEGGYLLQHAEHLAREAPDDDVAVECARDQSCGGLHSAQRPDGLGVGSPAPHPRDVRSSVRHHVLVCLCIELYCIVMFEHITSHHTNGLKYLAG